MKININYVPVEYEAFFIRGTLMNWACQHIIRLGECISCSAEVADVRG